MLPLPATNLRTNAGTWAVPCELLPAVGSFLHDAAPNESFDPHFHGQRLATTYLDTAAADLRRARRAGDAYLTLRVRCYQAEGRPEAYALSAKTGAEKFRAEIESETAHRLLRPGPDLLEILQAFLPAHLLARLLDLGREQPLLPVVCVRCRRYAVEDDTDRYTLDVRVSTDTGLCLPAAVLEFKSTAASARPPGSLQALGLRPLKLSKFLWATSFGGR